MKHVNASYVIYFNKKYNYANDERVLDEIKQASSLVVTSIKSKDLDLGKFGVMFLKVKNNKERNQKIYEAYQLGYSQHTISKCIGISQPHINRIVKQERGISITLPLQSYDISIIIGLV